MALKFPSIRDVAHDLRVENGTLDPADFPLDNGHGESESCDVRLQVLPDGRWAIRTGDSSYDPDHRGFWGCGSLNGRRFNSRELARDLVEQAKDQHAMSETEGRVTMNQHDLKRRRIRTVKPKAVPEPITERTDGVTVTLTAEQEDQGPEGSFATDEPDKDLEDIAEIRRRLNGGDDWAWCFVKVRVTYQGLTATDSLGGCCYENADDFRTNSGYYADMVATCLGQINADMRAIAACELAPHNKAILACTCGYKRNNGNGR